MSNRPNGTINVGFTSDLLKRVHEHRTNAVAGFTSRYNLKSLVYFEEHSAAAYAIQREKTLKHWVRAWKIELIEKSNPDWKDLFNDFTG
jgi:putative endonuclease